tara:strand:- start:295 stop:507 length:213 start_codon:yes stop_codon:yes gene_type:complete
MLYNFLKQYNAKEKKMIPPNNFDKFMLVLGFIGLFLSILTIVMVDIQFVVLVGWLFMIASIALLFKLLGG